MRDDKPWYAGIPGVQDATALVANLVAPVFMLGQLAEIPANHPGVGIHRRGGTNNVPRHPLRNFHLPRFDSFTSISYLYFLIWG